MHLGLELVGQRRQRKSKTCIHMYMYSMERERSFRSRSPQTPIPSPGSQRHLLGSSRDSRKKACHYRMTATASMLLLTQRLQIPFLTSISTMFFDIDINPKVSGFSRFGSLPTHGPPSTWMLNWLGTSTWYSHMAPILKPHSPSMASMLGLLTKCPKHPSTWTSKVQKTWPLSQDEE